MSQRFTLDDAAFRAGLRRLVSNAGDGGQQLVNIVGAEVVRVAKEAAPTRTNRMRDSIKARPGRDRRGPYSEVSVGPFYASFVEWGTTQDPARPFFRPALEQAGRSMRHNARLVRWFR